MYVSWLFKNANISVDINIAETTGMCILVQEHVENWYVTFIMTSA